MPNGNETALSQGSQDPNRSEDNSPGSSIKQMVHQPSANSHTTSQEAITTNQARKMKNAPSSSTSQQAVPQQTKAKAKKKARTVPKKKVETDSSPEPNSLNVHEKGDDQPPRARQQSPSPSPSPLSDNVAQPLPYSLYRELLARIPHERSGPLEYVPEMRSSSPIVEESSSEHSPSREHSQEISSNESSRNSSFCDDSSPVRNGTSAVRDSSSEREPAPNYEVEIEIKDPEEGTAEHLEEEDQELPPELEMEQPIATSSAATTRKRRSQRQKDSRNKIRRSEDRPETDEDSRESSMPRLDMYGSVGDVPSTSERPECEETTRMVQSAILGSVEMEPETVVEEPIKQDYREHSPPVYITLQPVQFLWNEAADFVETVDAESEELAGQRVPFFWNAAALADEETTGDEKGMMKKATEVNGASDPVGDIRVEQPEIKIVAGELKELESSPVEEDSQLDLNHSPSIQEEQPELERRKKREVNYGHILSQPSQEFSIVKAKRDEAVYTDHSASVELQLVQSVSKSDVVDGEQKREETSARFPWKSPVKELQVDHPETAFLWNAGCKSGKTYETPSHKEASEPVEDDVPTLPQWGPIGKVAEDENEYGDRSDHNGTLGGRDGDSVEQEFIPVIDPSKQNPPDELEKLDDKEPEDHSIDTGNPSEEDPEPQNPIVPECVQSVHEQSDDRCASDGMAVQEDVEEERSDSKSNATPKESSVKQAGESEGQINEREAWENSGNVQEAVKDMAEGEQKEHADDGDASDDREEISSAISASPCLEAVAQEMESDGPTTDAPTSSNRLVPYEESEDEDDEQRPSEKVEEDKEVEVKEIILMHFNGDDQVEEVSYNDFPDFSNESSSDIDDETEDSDSDEIEEPEDDKPEEPEADFDENGQIEEAAVEDESLEMPEDTFTTRKRGSSEDEKTEERPVKIMKVDRSGDEESSEDSQELEEGELVEEVDSYQEAVEQEEVPEEGEIVEGLEQNSEPADLEVQEEGELVKDLTNSPEPVDREDFQENGEIFEELEQNPEPADQEVLEKGEIVEGLEKSPGPEDQEEVPEDGEIVEELEQNPEPTDREEIPEEGQLIEDLEENPEPVDREEFQENGEIVEELVQKPEPTDREEVPEDPGEGHIAKELKTVEEEEFNEERELAADQLDQHPLSPPPNQQDDQRLKAIADIKRSLLIGYVPAEKETSASIAFRAYHLNPIYGSYVFSEPPDDVTSCQKSALKKFDVAVESLPCSEETIHRIIIGIDPSWIPSKSDGRSSEARSARLQTPVQKMEPVVARAEPKNREPTGAQLQKLVELNESGRMFAKTDQMEMDYGCRKTRSGKHMKGEKEPVVVQVERPKKKPRRSGRGRKNHGRDSSSEGMTGRQAELGRRSKTSASRFTPESQRRPRSMNRFQHLNADGTEPGPSNASMPMSPIVEGKTCPKEESRKRKTKTPLRRTYELDSDDDDYGIGDMPISDDLTFWITEEHSGYYRRALANVEQLLKLAPPEIAKFHSNEEDGELRLPSKIQIGRYLISSWYGSPFPIEYIYMKKVIACEYCLAYTGSDLVMKRHVDRCKTRGPPGKEIYRDVERNISVFEVDGCIQKYYCQRLCLIARLFLSSKTVFYDTEPFLFYVVTVNDAEGWRLAGYFSKEKYEPDLNNLSCIMILPPFQSMGLGRVLIDLSYALSRREEWFGGPEQPLSEHGLAAYGKYWRAAIFKLFSLERVFVAIEHDYAWSVQDVSDETGIHAQDCLQMLELLGWLQVNEKKGPDATGTYSMYWDVDWDLVEKCHNNPSYFDEKLLDWKPRKYTPAMDGFFELTRADVEEDEEKKRLRQEQQTPPHQQQNLEQSTPATASSLPIGSVKKGGRRQTQSRSVRRDLKKELTKRVTVSDEISDSSGDEESPKSRKTSQKRKRCADSAPKKGERRPDSPDEDDDAPGPSSRRGHIAPDKKQPTAEKKPSSSSGKGKNRTEKEEDLEKKSEEDTAPIVQKKVQEKPKRKKGRPVKMKKRFGIHNRMKAAAEAAAAKKLQATNEEIPAKKDEKEPETSEATAEVVEPKPDEEQEKSDGEEGPEIDLDVEEEELVRNYMIGTPASYHSETEELSPPPAQHFGSQEHVEENDAAPPLLVSEVANLHVSQPEEVTAVEEASPPLVEDYTSEDDDAPPRLSPQYGKQEDHVPVEEVPVDDNTVESSKGMQYHDPLGSSSSMHMTHSNQMYSHHGPSSHQPQTTPGSGGIPSCGRAVEQFMSPIAGMPTSVSSVHSVHNNSIEMAARPASLQQQPQQFDMGGPVIAQMAPTNGVMNSTAQIEQQNQLMMQQHGFNNPPAPIVPTSAPEPGRRRSDGSRKRAPRAQPPVPAPNTIPPMQQNAFPMAPMPGFPYYPYPAPYGTAYPMWDPSVYSFNPYYQPTMHPQMNQTAYQQQFMAYQQQYNPGGQNAGTAANQPQNPAVYPPNWFQNQNMR
ncbi:unnamed protein product [Caenorhabditis sp. 36 PRJEB53466]|nr:unnamed protein product [Caenorhabditis sp. 36 PRJEB53466]